MAIWDNLLTERDKKVFSLYADLDRRPARGFGVNPALVVIDVNVAFVGDDPSEDILESMKRYPASSGKEGWESIYHTVPLIASARDNSVPIIYTTGGLKAMSQGSRHTDLTSPDSATGKINAISNIGIRHSDLVNMESGQTIISQIAPTREDIVIYKSAPSAFFGTSLVQHLRDLNVDTVICIGCTTSGCVRASVVDAFSYHFRVGVVEECTFDRAEASHQASLFDMNIKYADVVSVEYTKGYFRSLKSS